MNWIYGIQRYITITRLEIRAFLTISSLLAVGSAALIFTDGNPKSPYQFPAADINSQAISEYKSDALTTHSDSGSVQQLTNLERRPASLINVNTASSAQLQSLPRIGPKMAARIISFRRENGGFKSVNDLLGVRGIGKKTLERLKGLVSI